MLVITASAASLITQATPSPDETAVQIAISAEGIDIEEAGPPDQQGCTLTEEAGTVCARAVRG